MLHTRASLSTEKKIFLGLMASLLLYIGYVNIFKKKKSFSGVPPMSNEVQITLTNPTPTSQSIRLFDSASSITNPFVHVSLPETIPSLNYFDQSLSQKPRSIGSIQITTNKPSTGATGQTNAQMKVTNLDANGNESTSILTPTVSPYQGQGNTTVVTPNNLVLDGKTFIVYEVEPFTTVNMTLNFK